MNMTPTIEQYRLLAKIAGLEMNKTHVEWRDFIWSFDTDGMPCEIWNPFTDYNAIMPIIAKQKLKVKEQLRHIFHEKYGKHVLSATPEQLATELLVAMTEMKEMKEIG